MPDKGIRRSQANDLDLSGHAAADQFASTDAPAKTDGHIGKWLGGNIVDGVVPVSDLMTSTGAGGTSQGMTVGGYGSLYGQVPRGVVDGVNTRFYLDYNLLSWVTVLNIGDRIQLPGVQGDPNNPPFGVMAVPGGEYQVELGKNYLVTAHAPRPTDEFYIDYWRADPASVGVSAVLTVTSSYTPDAAADPTAAISIYGTSFAFGRIPQKTSNIAWSKTTETFDVTSTLLAVQLTDPLGVQELNVYFYTEFGSNGTGFNSYFNIYDAFLTVTYADGSSQVFRPTTTTAPANTTIATMVENPPTSSSAYAIDADPNTFAQYHSTAWGTLATPTAFILGGFSPYSSIPPPTPIPLPTGGVSSQSGDYSATPTDDGKLLTFDSSSPVTLNLPPQISAPTAPTLSQTAGGSLPATTYYATVSYTNASGETIASAESSLAVSANNLPTIASPAVMTGATGYNVYLGTASGLETKQNFTSIPIGTDWTLPTTGLVSGPVAPTVNTASPSSTYELDLSNTGTGTLTITPRTGTTLNGGTSSQTLGTGQTGTIRSDGNGGYTLTTGSASSGSFHVWVDGTEIF